MITKIRLTTLLFSISFLASVSCVQATIVEVRTNVGNFQVNLFDNTTPSTVQNFLSYVNAGAYANNTVHRSVPSFVIQMGGFEYANSFPPEAIAIGVPVINEPILSNVRGTLAMAKQGNNVNSATSQFFVNLANNAANLDAQNGGFTVFGQILGNGMEIVDQIAGLPRFNYGQAFQELPLQNFTATDAANNLVPNDNNLIIISDIVVIDAAVSTNPNLTPVRNTLINSGGGNNGGSGGESGGGGSVGIVLTACLMIISLARRQLTQ